MPDLESTVLLGEAADRIERELICCDVFERLSAKPVQQWTDAERREHRRHSICYWGAAARAIVLDTQANPAPAAVEENPVPFDALPSGVDIARYFVDHTDHRNNGCEGIDLFRNGNDYCYLWVEATFDHDLWVSYLLDIRTAVGKEDRQFREARDFLFVRHGAGGVFDVEWHHHPIDFDAPVQDHYARNWAGWNWFLGRMQASLEREDACLARPAPTCAPTCALCGGHGQVYDGPHLTWKPCPMCTTAPAEEATDA